MKHKVPTRESELEFDVFEAYHGAIGGVDVPCSERCRVDVPYSSEFHDVRQHLSDPTDFCLCTRALGHPGQHVAVDPRTSRPIARWPVSADDVRVEQDED